MGAIDPVRGKPCRSGRGLSRTGTFDTGSLLPLVFLIPLVLPLLAAGLIHVTLGAVLIFQVAAAVPRAA